jgi:RNA polymerase sigma-70 factor (ECF subfamily)
MGLKDAGNQTAWGQFVQRYQPVLIRFAQKAGLPLADAEDAAQETLLAFSSAYRQGRYDRDRGRLRSWLMGIAKNKILHLHRRKGREINVNESHSKTGVIEGAPDDRSMSEMWETEWRQAVLKACMDEVRDEVEPTTMQSFELIMIRQWSAEKVAVELGMTVNAVNKAKRRVTSRMREVYQRLEKEW